MKKILKVLLILIGLVAAVIFLLFVKARYMPREAALEDNYFLESEFSAPLEKKYSGKGLHMVSYEEYDFEKGNLKKIEVWYPKVLESSKKYPLIIVTNPSNTPASLYKPFFEHLASWGFIVAGNEDEATANGLSSSITLDYLVKLNKNPNSIFFGKIDISNTGIIGHSQGGPGAIHAITDYSNGKYYKTLFTGSAPSGELAKALKWDYDAGKITIAYFMTAGTGKIDAGDKKGGGISPLKSLKENYNTMSDAVFKIRARCADADHLDMLAITDPYMTAWMLLQLQNDKEAGKVFIGRDAEILSNQKWQDVEKNR